MKHLIENLSKFDRVVTQYGKFFDLPFLMTRALNLGLDFPPHKHLWQSDTYIIAKQKLCVSSRRLENLARFLNVKTEKTPITSEHWLGALMGKKKSLEYILDHCCRDVKMRERVYNRIYQFAAVAKNKYIIFAKDRNDRG